MQYELPKASLKEALLDLAGVIVGLAIVGMIFILV